MSGSGFQPLLGRFLVDSEPREGYPTFLVVIFNLMMLSLFAFVIFA